MKRSSMPAFLLLLAAFFCSAAAMAAAKGEHTPSAKDKCPVCGMFVAKYPDWTAVARTADGAAYYYDGPKDMLTHYLNTGRYTPGRKQSDLSTLLVKEYYSLKMIDARQALYVTGSNVYGPMGAELIPFASRIDAETFLKDHKGKRIVRFSEISQQILKELK